MLASAISTIVLLIALSVTSIRIPDTTTSNSLLLLVAIIATSISAFGNKSILAGRYVLLLGIFLVGLCGIRGILIVDWSVFIAFGPLASLSIEGFQSPTETRQKDELR